MSTLLETTASALSPDLIIGVDYSWNTDVYSKLTALPAVTAARGTAVRTR